MMSVRAIATEMSIQWLLQWENNCKHMHVQAKMDVYSLQQEYTAILLEKYKNENINEKRKNAHIAANVAQQIMQHDGHTDISWWIYMMDIQIMQHDGHTNISWLVYTNQLIPVCPSCCIICI